MTREEKLQLNKERQKAVREAWSREKDLVSKGRGTVDWTYEQQKELIETGRVQGFEGQHMKSVNEYPEYAGSLDNIQLLSHDDHLAAHNCSSLNDKSGYHSPTNGFYDTKTNEIVSFDDGPPRAPKVIELSNPYVNKTQLYETEKNNELGKYKSRIEQKEMYRRCS